MYMHNDFTSSQLSFIRGVLIIEVPLVPAVKAVHCVLIFLDTKINVFQCN